MMRRPPHLSRLWTWWLLGTAVLITAAFLVGQHVRSPWASAEQNATRPVIATASVERGELRPTVPEMTGVLSLGSSIEVHTTDSGSLREVVTEIATAPGSTVTGGTRLLDVSGRPLIAMELPFPLYRDLRGGDQGPDVHALQAALAEMGLYRGALDGIFGSGTSAAVERFYAAVGSSAPQPDADAVQAARDAQAALQSAVVGGLPTPDVDAFRTAASEAAADALPWLRATEIVALPTGDATVTAVAPLGTIVTPDAAVATLRTGSANVSFRVGLADLKYFPVGATVELSQLGSSGPVIAGTVTGNSAFQQSTEAQPLPGYDVAIGVTPDPSWADGTSIRVAPSAGSEAETGLLVPASAVRSDAEGRYVHVVTRQALDSPGAVPRQRVAVTTGITSGGIVLVTGDLKEGDLVVTAETTSP